MNSDNLILEELEKTGIGFLTGTFRSETSILGILGGIEMHGKTGYFQIRLFANGTYLGEHTLRHTGYLPGNDEKFEGFIVFGKGTDEEVEYNDADIYVVGWYEGINSAIACQNVGYFVAIQKRTIEEDPTRYKW